MDDLRYQVDLLSAMNQKLSNDERMYRAICEQSNRAFIYILPEEGTVKTLGRWDEYFDFRPTELTELRHLMNLIDDDYRDQAMEAFFPERLGKSSAFLEIPTVGKKEWMEVNTTVNYGDAGVVVEKVITFRNITKFHAYKDELSFMAYFDFVTGLYNRNYFISKLKEFIEKAEKEKSIVSVMLVDIDDFHKINDSLGIVMGDEVIQNVGLYIKTFTSENIIGSRFDGDIYALAIYDPIGSTTPDSIYEEIKNHFSKPMQLTDGNEVSISMTAGVAEYPEASESALELVNSAEIVMIKAKENGNSSIKYFDSQVQNEFLDNIKIETKLKEAVHRKNFFLNYQPQYYADNKRLRGVEALVRWQDDEGHLISPATFIPIAEKNGSIISIGDFVLEEAVKQHMEWKKKFDTDMILSVNISAIQYKRHDFVGRVINTLRRYDMPLEELELEITESVLIDDFKMVVDKMEELRDYGIKVSIDDFGTGYSSLSYLKGLPVDTLKIDKSFVDTVMKDEASKVITETIVSLSKKLGYETVAEGVESDDQYEYLKSINCNMIQGYYLGKPMDSEAIEELLLRMM